MLAGLHVAGDTISEGLATHFPADRDVTGAGCSMPVGQDDNRV